MTARCTVWCGGTPPDLALFFAGVVAAALLIWVLTKVWAAQGIPQGWVVGPLLVGPIAGWLLFKTGSPVAWGVLFGLIGSSAVAAFATRGLTSTFDAQIEQFGASLGLTYTPALRELVSPIDVLTGMDGLNAVRVLKGTWKDMPIVVGEYRYARYSAVGDDPPSYGVMRFGWTTIDRALPRLIIKRHDSFSRLWSRVRPKYVSLGDAQFDRVFRVSATSPEDAVAALGRRVRAWLVENGRGAFLIDGQDVLICVDYARGTEHILAMLALLRGLRNALLK